MLRSLDLNLRLARRQNSCLAYITKSKQNCTYLGM